VKTLEKNRAEYNPYKDPEFSDIFIPEFIKPDNPEISFRDSFIISTAAHFLGAGFLWLIIKLILFLLLFFGLNMPLKVNPEHKIQDIEFVLKKPAKNQIKLSLKKSSPNIGGSKSNVKTRETNKIVNRNPAKITPKAHNETVSPSKKQPRKGNKPPKNDEPDAFSIPVPKIKPLSSDMGYGTQGASGYSSPASSPTDVTASGEGTGSSEDGDSAGAGRRRAGGYGKDSNINNILKDPDLTPYINELQRKIRWNWKPPVGEENKKVELFLRIAKDGKLVILNIKKTSLNPDIDNAATNAVKKAIPLSPLPSGFRKSYLDVVFTFDYNAVLTNSKY